MESIEGIKKGIEKLVAEKTEQNERRSNAKNDDERRAAENKLSELEDRLSKTQRRLEEHTRRLEENKAEAEKRVANGEKCRDARRVMQGVFSDIITRAKGESDPEIRGLAERKISSEWEPENREHERHINENVLTAIEKCNACRAGNR